MRIFHLSGMQTMNAHRIFFIMCLAMILGMSVAAMGDLMQLLWDHQGVRPGACSF